LGSKIMRQKQEKPQEKKDGETQYRVWVEPKHSSEHELE
jgi:hypothetical protein